MWVLGAFSEMDRRRRKGGRESAGWSFVHKEEINITVQYAAAAAVETVLPLHPQSWKPPSQKSNRSLWIPVCREKEGRRNTECKIQKCSLASEQTHNWTHRIWSKVLDSDQMARHVSEGILHVLKQASFRLFWSQSAERHTASCGRGCVLGRQAPGIIFTSSAQGLTSWEDMRVYFGWHTLCHKW